MTRPLWIFSGVLLSMNALSQDANIPNGPFAGIVARNMFSLVPIPPPAPPANDPVDPPPKITPTGIMNIFGRDQALFKASNLARPGQPSKEGAYVLSEGERQDDIEVVKIDHVDGVITFNNHGTIQELPLVPVKDGGTVASAGGGGGIPGVAIPRPGFPPSTGNLLGFHNSHGMNPAGFTAASSSPGFSQANTTQTQPNFGNSYGSYGGGGSYQSPNSQQPQNNIEDQVLNTARQIAEIEQNRIATQDQVSQGKLPPLPPTVLTPTESTGSGGVGGLPLVFPARNPPELPPLP
jgi:hypothetical protein